MKIRWNLEIRINLICLDEATRTRADDQNPERSKKSSFIAEQIQKPPDILPDLTTSKIYLVDPTYRAGRTTGTETSIYSYIY